jgi:phytanoyl-CoA hydroxylase
MIHGMRTTTPLIHDEFHYGEAEHESFEREGYFIFANFLTDGALNEARRHIDRMIAQRAEGFCGTEMMSPHQLGEKWMWDIATHPKVLDFAERRLGPDLVLWHTDLLNKEPRTGREILWHQDQVYWDEQQVRAPVAGLWVPFDDVDEKNGTMSILPGWHTKGKLECALAEGDFFGYSIDPKLLPENVDELEALYRLRAGQAATHGSFIPHRSRPNQSNAWRRVMTFQFMRADAEEMGERHYTSYLDHEYFAREYYLVRGEDVKNRGLKRSPYEWVT